MKARIKATGEIVDVYCDFKGMEHDFLDYNGKGYMSDEITIFDNEDYEQGWADGWDEAVKSEIPKIHPKLKGSDPDYWTRLEHQYAGMAMQALIIDASYAGNEGSKYLVEECTIIAHALVEKYKKEERK